MGQCDLPEGGQCHFRGTEEESTIPVHVAHGHPVLAAATRAVGGESGRTGGATEGSRATTATAAVAAGGERGGESTGGQNFCRCRSDGHEEWRFSLLDAGEVEVREAL